MAKTSVFDFFNIFLLLLIYSIIQIRQIYCTGHFSFPLSSASSDISFHLNFNPHQVDHLRLQFQTFSHHHFAFYFHIIFFILNLTLGRGEGMVWLWGRSWETISHWGWKEGMMMMRRRRIPFHVSYWFFSWDKKFIYRKFISCT